MMLLFCLLALSLVEPATLSMVRFEKIEAEFKEHIATKKYDEHVDAVFQEDSAYINGKGEIALGKAEIKTQLADEMSGWTPRAIFGAVVEIKDTGVFGVFRHDYFIEMKPDDGNATAFLRRSLIVYKKSDDYKDVILMATNEFLNKTPPPPLDVSKREVGERTAALVAIAEQFKKDVNEGKKDDALKLYGRNASIISWNGGTIKDHDEIKPYLVKGPADEGDYTLKKVIKRDELEIWIYLFDVSLKESSGDETLKKVKTVQVYVWLKIDNEWKVWAASHHPVEEDSSE